MKRISPDPAGVSRRWRERYTTSDGQWPHLLRNRKETFEQLLALGDAITADDVERIMGNEMWTKSPCIECGQWHRELIQLGEEPDVESRTVTVCLECARKYADFIREHTSHE